MYTSVSGLSITATNWIAVGISRVDEYFTKQWCSNGDLVTCLSPVVSCFAVPDACISVNLFFDNCTRSNKPKGAKFGPTPRDVSLVSDSRVVVEVKNHPAWFWLTLDLIARSYDIVHQLVGTPDDDDDGERGSYN